MDTTGAQYEYADPLCPWRDFEQRQSGKINRECEFAIDGFVSRIDMLHSCAWAKSLWKSGVTMNNRVNST